MLVADIINGLKYGEFRYFNFGETEQEGLAEVHYPMIINLINQGMIEIYSKVPLMYREVLIQPVTQMNIYRLHPKHASTSVNSTATKFIIDTFEDPFKGNIIKIEAVYNEFGIELPMNDKSNIDSVFTPSIDTLQVPKPDERVALGIIYRSMPDQLEETLDISQELELPLVYKQALMMFVVAKAHLGRAHLDSEPRHNIFYRNFLAELDRLKADGHFISDSTTGSKFANRGYA